MTREREKWQLSLRPSVEFEAQLLGALRAVPKGYGKIFLVRAARLFAQEATTQEELEALIYRFVEEVQPLCLEAMPSVRHEPRPVARQETLPGIRAEVEDHLGV